MREVKRSDIVLRKLFDPKVPEENGSIDTLLLIKFRRWLPPLKAGEEVLFRCPDDGWYFPGKVTLDCDDFSYIITDNNGHREKVWREDIVCLNDRDTENLADGDSVLVAHPDYRCSYCPATCKSVEAQLVKLFDDTERKLERSDFITKMTSEKSRRDGDVIKHLAERWKSEEVIARQKNSGEYHTGKVKRLVRKSYTEYLINWIKEDDSESTEPDRVKAIHIFGAFTPNRYLKLTDHVLAPADTGMFYLPGKITSLSDEIVKVQLVNGSEISTEKSKCFWISPNYYNDAVISYANSHT